MPAREKPPSNDSLRFAHAAWCDIADKVVGMRIRELREQSGADFRDIAHPLGLAVKALKAIESGEESADSALLHCLGGRFQVPVAFFFEGLPAAGDAAEKPDPAAQSNSAPRARELVKLINIYASLPDKKLRKTLMELIESLGQAKL
jgi:transcriptional regulator with XRE-family HTH domain